MPEIFIEPPERDIQGVTPEAAALVEKALKDGKRYFGSSGASLTWQAFHPGSTEKGIKPSLAKVGLEGERDTTKVLKKWIADKPNAVLVDSVHIRDADGDEEVDEETGIIDGPDTDHVLIIGTEIILVDTKRWKSKKRYSVSPEGHALRTERPFPGGALRMPQAVDLWLNYLDADISIIGLVCINSEEVSVYRNGNWYTAAFRLVEVEKLEELLNMKWDAITDFDKQHINSTIVAQCAVSCVKPYDPRTGVFSAKALAEFK